MKQLLRLRHWQLFLISWGILAVFFVGLFIKPEVIGDTIVIWIILFPIGLVNSFLWVWSTVTVLIFIIPPGMRPNSKLFKICFWIPTICIFGYLGSIYFNFLVHKLKSYNPELEMKIIKGLALLSVACIVYGLLFAARIIKTAELQRSLKIHEYFSEFILMIFAPVGLWIIQPRLNKIVREWSP